MLQSTTTAPTQRCVRLRSAYNQALDEIGAEGVAELKRWPARADAATAPTYSYKVRDQRRHRARTTRRA